VVARTWSAYMEFLAPEFLGDVLGALTEGPALERRFSVLIQGSSDLGERLQAGIDTVIITSTATNLCCEATARDSEVAL
jgi:ureidoacrylate peracid hydrolase